MKRKILTLIMISVIILLKNILNAQATNGLPGAGNTFVVGRFLGYGVASGNLDFRTNNQNRMTLTNNTGRLALGLNFNAPLSMFHINGINDNTGEVFRTDAPLGATHWRMELGGIQRFSITANVDSVRTGAMRNGLYNVFTNSTDRFQLENGAGANTGRATLSDAVPTGFNARDRLHLYQTAASNVFTRFGHFLLNRVENDDVAQRIIDQNQIIR